MKEDSKSALFTDGERGSLGEIELIDEEGGSRKYNHLMTLTLRGGSYLALSEIDDSDSDEIEVGFLRIETSSDGSDMYKDDVPDAVVEELIVLLESALDSSGDEGDGEGDEEE